MTQDLKTKIAEAINKALLLASHPVRNLSEIASQAALQAIHDAGYRIVHHDAIPAAARQAYDAGRAGNYHILINMIQASQPKTEEG